MDLDKYTKSGMYSGKHGWLSSALPAFMWMISKSQLFSVHLFLVLMKKVVLSSGIVQMLPVFLVFLSSGCRNQSEPGPFMSA